MKNFKFFLFAVIAVLALCANAQEDKNKEIMKEVVDHWPQTKDKREATKRAIDEAKTVNITDLEKANKKAQVRHQRDNQSNNKSTSNQSNNSETSNQSNNKPTPKPSNNKPTPKPSSNQNKCNATACQAASAIPSNPPKK